MKKISSKITSIAIALLLCLNMFPAIAFAEGENAPPNPDKVQDILTDTSESEDVSEAANEEDVPVVTNEAEAALTTTNEAALITENSYPSDGTENTGSDYATLLHTISGTANPPEGGIVIGGGKFLHTGFTGLTAIENPGYTFSRWTENGVEVGTNRLLMVYFITADHHYVAEFVKQTFTIDAIASPAEGGTIDGTGIVEYGDSAALTATANPGYTFSKWTENGIDVGNDATLTIDHITADHTYIAEFVKQTFTISASADPANGGTIEGTGMVEYGDSATLTATANKGYAFSKWTEDGKEIGTDAILEISNITADHAYVAIFTKNSVKPTDPKPADKPKTNTTKVNAAKTTTKAAVNTKTAAKTGDASPVAGLLVLMAVAGSVPVVLYFKRKKSIR